MNWSLFSVLQECCLLLKRHPQILISVASLLIFALFRHRMNQRGSRVFVNWPVVGMLPTIIANRNRLHDHMVSLLKEFDCTLLFKGPLFLKMNYLITCNPANANHMFNAHFSNYPKGEGLQEIFDIFGDGIFNADGDSWVVQRRMAHAHMSTPSFRAEVARCTRDKVVRVLLPLVTCMVDFDKVIDLSDIFKRFTFDTTCTLVLGVDPGCLAPEFPTVPFAKAIDHIEQVLMFRHIVPRIWWKLSRWLKVGGEKKMAEARVVIDDFIAQCIQERRERREARSIKEGPIDLLGSYMNSRSSQSDDKFLRDTLLTFLGAGKDTTGAALVWFFWLIANNPEIEKKILEELKDVRTMLASSSDDEITVFNADEIDELVYLHATICETLRLYPPVPFNHKEALKEDVLPSGDKVQPGTMVIFSSYAMGRMKHIWGEDCLEFKPERWITKEGKLKHEPTYKFIAFHSGPRSCLGRSMAFTQIKLVAAAVIYNYNVQVVEGHVAEPELAIVLQTKNGLMVKLKKRIFSGH